MFPVRNTDVDAATLDEEFALHPDRRRILKGSIDEIDVWFYFWIRRFFGGSEKGTETFQTEPMNAIRVKNRTVFRLETLVSSTFPAAKNKIL